MAILPGPLRGAGALPRAGYRRLLHRLPRHPPPLPPDQGARGQVRGPRQQLLVLKLVLAASGPRPLVGRKQGGIDHAARSRGAGRLERVINDVFICDEKLRLKWEVFIARYK